MLANILNEFGIPTKQVSLIKMFLNEIYNKVCMGKHLSEVIPFQNDLKQCDALLS
jgi:hypothetical protein